MRAVRLSLFALRFVIPSEARNSSSIVIPSEERSDESRDLRFSP